MKYILLIIAFTVSIKSFSQSLDTVSVNLTLRAGDWAFIASMISSDDSVSIVQLRRLRDTIRLANPATFNTNIRFNGISGNIVFNIYTSIKGLPVTMYEQVGSNINTQVKAISNTTLQTAITGFDNQAASLYLNRRSKGKYLLLDN